MAILNVYTDGSCITDKYTTQSGQAGYAFVIEHSAKDYVDSGVVEAASNGAELWAVIKALEFIDQHRLMDGYDEIIVHTDSKYVVSGANKWIPLWKERNWQRVDKRKAYEKGIMIAYHDEWKRFDALSNHLPVKVKWIPSHCGIKQNELVNGLAKKAAHKGR